MVAKHALVGHRLKLVIERCRRPMRVDVLHVGRLHACSLHRGIKAVRHPFALGMRRCDMVRIASRRVARKLAVDLCTASERMFLRLEEQNTSALPHDEARPVGVERPARGLRRVIRRRAHSTHAVETREAQRRNGSLCTASQHNIALTPLQVLEGLSNSMSACCTSRYNAVVGSLSTHLNRNHGTGSVADDRGKEEGRNTLGPLVEQDVAAAFDGIKASHARPNQYAKALGVDRLRVQSTVSECALGGSHGKVGIAVLPLRSVLIPVLRNIKVLHLRRDRRLVCRLWRRTIAVEVGDGSNATFSLAKVVKKLVRIVTERCEGAEARHDHLLPTRLRHSDRYIGRSGAGGGVERLCAVEDDGAGSHTQ
mmetsp:Transcript_15100/g.41349  ORF Transcript_15100/g.41349 Transcript_15100/m.41349 type:complete len:367 (+) Transcript_15100:1142-2242(+)